MLSLVDALARGKLADFIAQQEAASVGPVNGADFDALADKVIRNGQSDGQTSGSLRSGGSSEK